MSRSRQLLQAATVFVAVSLATAGLAYADQLLIDNDFAHNGNQDKVTLTAAAGAPITISGTVVINYQGNKHMAASSTVTLTGSSTDLPAGEYTYHARWTPSSYSCAAGTNPPGSCLGSDPVTLIIKLTVTGSTNSAPSNLAPLICPLVPRRTTPVSSR